MWLPPLRLTYPRQVPTETLWLSIPYGVATGLELTFSLVLANVSARRREGSNLTVWCETFRLIQGNGRGVPVGDFQEQPRDASGPSPLDDRVDQC